MSPFDLQCSIQLRQVNKPCTYLTCAFAIQERKVSLLPGTRRERERDRKEVRNVRLSISALSKLGWKSLENARDDIINRLIEKSLIANLPVNVQGSSVHLAGHLE